MSRDRFVLKRNHPRRIIEVMRRRDTRRVRLHSNHHRDNIPVRVKSRPLHHGASSDSECAINLWIGCERDFESRGSVCFTFFSRPDREINDDDDDDDDNDDDDGDDGIADITVRRCGNTFPARPAVRAARSNITSRIRYLTRLSRPSTGAARVSAWRRTFWEVL